MLDFMYRGAYQCIVAQGGAALSSEAEHVRIWMDSRRVKQADRLFCLQINKNCHSVLSDQKEHHMAQARHDCD